LQQEDTHTLQTVDGAGKEVLLALLVDCVGGR
jgi:hypothetical protein